jgi:hypothetical protein
MTRPISTPSPLDGGCCCDMARATGVAQDQGVPPRAADDADCECDDCDCPICFPGCC